MSDNKEDLAPSGMPWQTTLLASAPPIDQWHDWKQLDAKAWPKRVEKSYRIVPTTCFNCEAACGLISYIDKSTGEVEKIEGNPHHPGSRGRNCAKGPATLSQVKDPQRILYPMKRSGPRGSGQFERTTWDEVIETLAGRIRKAIQEDRRTQVMYHVGRPGHDGYMERVLKAWGVDGYNSHTNVCSAAARLGYAAWSGGDRPSPDHANAKFILLLSAHLETGHYFNPHAQRIIEAKMKGAKIATVDVRLSNTASMSDYWVSPMPGTEAAMLLAIAHLLLENGTFDAGYLRKWTNWKAWQHRHDPAHEGDFDAFVQHLRQRYASYTPEWAAEECRIDAELIEELAHEIGKAHGGFASHVWRNAAAGNEGGWQVARCLQFLCVLTGSVGTKGGTALAGTNKFVPKPPLPPRPQTVWNELLFPRAWPLSHHELSFLLPHLMDDQGAHIDTYFTRVYNPVWTNPDGFAWMDMLSDEVKVGCHATLTPTWNETAIYADYVLPMGLATERHDLMSQETHAAAWISFRQPVLRVAAEEGGQKTTWTWESNPGEVWEEDEFWIALSWAIDPDGTLGIRKHFESPYRPGERITIEEYYRWIFENSVPGLPEKATEEGISPLEYMRKYGCFEVKHEVYEPHADPVDVSSATLDEQSGLWLDGEQPIAVDIEGEPMKGFGTPSRRLEIWSDTIEDWGHPGEAFPGYIKSHVHARGMDPKKGEFPLVPTFRLPTLIHTRSANSKWLYELSNSNPLWMNVEDAKVMGVETGDLVRVSTRIGHFVNRVWATEGMRPGVVACSHHLGRWRIDGQPGTDKWGAAPVRVARETDGNWTIRRTGDIGPFESSDPDSKNVFWSDGGVHQNLTFPVQPDPISGMHCWHQVVKVTKAEPGDAYGDVTVDPKKAREVYEEWRTKAEAASSDPNPDNLRRPLWLARHVRPADEAYRLPTDA